MTLKCPTPCPNWQPGIDFINGCQFMAQLHGTYKQGPPAYFSFCPYCGEKLVGNAALEEDYDDN